MNLNSKRLSESNYKIYYMNLIHYLNRSKYLTLESLLSHLRTSRADGSTGRNGGKSGSRCCRMMVGMRMVMVHHVRLNLFQSLYNENHLPVQIFRICIFNFKIIFQFRINNVIFQKLINQFKMKY